MIRLTVAHAKCRLSRVATEEDAKVALEIMSYALYHEVQSTETSTETPKETEEQQPEGKEEEKEVSEKKDDEDSSSEDIEIEDSEEIVIEESEPSQEEEVVIPTGNNRKRRRPSNFGSDDEQPKSKKQKSSYTSDSSTEITSSRAEEFGRLLVKYMTGRHLSECKFSILCEKVNSLRPSSKFNSQEALAAVKYLEKKGNLLFRDETVHLF